MPGSDGGWDVTIYEDEKIISEQVEVYEMFNNVFFFFFFFFFFCKYDQY